MSIKDPTWKYNDAEESRKPGYPSRRMALYRYRLKKEAEAKAAQTKNVTTIKRSK